MIWNLLEKIKAWSIYEIDWEILLSAQSIMTLVEFLNSWKVKNNY